MSEAQRSFDRFMLYAREHYAILRLAIYKVDGKYLENDEDVMRYDKSEQVWKRAIAVANALGYKQEYEGEYDG